jgi:hypothetical protein
MTDNQTRSVTADRTIPLRGQAIHNRVAMIGSRYADLIRASCHVSSSGQATQTGWTHDRNTCFLVFKSDLPLTCRGRPHMTPMRGFNPLSSPAILFHILPLDPCQGEKGIFFMEFPISMLLPATLPAEAKDGQFLG